RTQDLRIHIQELDDPHLVRVGVVSVHVTRLAHPAPEDGHRIADQEQVAVSQLRAPVRGEREAALVPPPSGIVAVAIAVSGSGSGPALHLPVRPEVEQVRELGHLLQEHAASPVAAALDERLHDLTNSSVRALALPLSSPRLNFLDVGGGLAAEERIGVQAGDATVAVAVAVVLPPVAVGGANLLPEPAAVERLFEGDGVALAPCLEHASNELLSSLRLPPRGAAPPPLIRPPSRSGEARRGSGATAMNMKALLLLLLSLAAASDGRSCLPAFLAASKARFSGHGADRPHRITNLYEVQALASSSAPRANDDDDGSGRNATKDYFIQQVSTKAGALDSKVFGWRSGTAREYVLEQGLSGNSVSEEEAVDSIMRDYDESGKYERTLPQYEPEQTFVAIYNGAEGEPLGLGDSFVRQNGVVGVVTAQLRRRSPLIAGPSNSDDPSADAVPSVPLPSPHIYIANMNVGEKMRRKGVGLALLSAVGKYANRWAEVMDEKIPLVLSVENDNIEMPAEASVDCVGLLKKCKSFPARHQSASIIFGLKTTPSSMVSSASSVTSFSSLDNVSRSNMLRRQREAALRRGRQNHLPERNESFGSDRGRPASHQSSFRMSSVATTAMADVMAWEEAKTKERIEARIKEEEVRKAEEARMRVERARLAEVEAEAARAAELEKFEREQLELRLKLAEEQKAREEAARRLEQEARRLAEAKADAERLEKERLAAESRRAELERLENQLRQERMERERLSEAERAKAEAERQRHDEEVRMAEQSRERHFRPSLQGSANDGMCPPSNDRHGERDGMRVAAQPVPPMNCQTGPMAAIESTIADDSGELPNAIVGSNNGYQRYLSSFHQPIPVDDGDNRGEQGEDATVISELTVGNSPRGSTSVAQVARNNTFPTANSSEARNSKIKRSISTRSLSFNEVEKAGQTTSDDEAKPAKDASKRPSTKVTSIHNANLDDPKVMRSILMNPCPKGEGMVQCCIRRNKGIKNALFPEYRIYLKSGNSKTETFLMTSKKRVGNKTSNYLISMSRNDHDKNSESILGKLRSNFLGTEYMIYDHGKNPGYEDSYYDEKKDSDVRCELGAILYAANTSLGSKGPRKMKVCISKPDNDGNPLKVWQPTNKDDDRMATCLKKETPDLEKLLCLENKPPSWNEEAGAYVLNFNGRVTMASVKNFQLMEGAGGEEHMMQFGRTAKDEFSLDVKWPMSLYQAFAVALSSFDSKLGCD
ncbi:hypothetical protein ACHAWF_006995, partial [Thalassiosira exigua]